MEQDQLTDSDSHSLCARRFTRWTQHGIRIALSLVAVMGPIACGPSFAQETEHRMAVLEVYVREDNGRSETILKSLQAFARARQDVVVRTYRVDEINAHRERFETISKVFQIEKPPLPAVYSCGALLLGLKETDDVCPRIEEVLTVHTFVRSGCARCNAAKAFLKKIEGKYRCFTFRQHDVVQDEASRETLLKLAEHYGKQATSLPAFYFCNQLSIGFDSEETSGRRIEAILDKWTLPRPNKKPESEEQSAVPSPSAAFDAQSIALFSVSDGPGEVDSGDEVPPAIGFDDHGDAVAQPISDLPLLPQADKEDVLLAPEPPDDSRLILPEPGDGARVRTQDVPLPNNPATDSLEVPLFGRLSQSRLGMPAFTFLVGLVDGFNPCAMWVLLFLLSVLVNLKSRAKILAVAGTFVVVSGLAYFAFMAAWLNVLLFVGYLRAVQVALGCVALVVGTIHIKDFFAFKKGVSLSIPESAKPSIYARVRRIVTAENLTAAVSCAIVLAVLVNIVELLCTAGLPALYSEILTLQGYPPWKNYAYLGLYNLAYMLDDLVMVSVVVITLGRHKLQERGGRWLKLLSGVAIASLGIVMIVKPEWLV